MTVGDSAFPRCAWLVKVFSDTTWNEKERLFNEKFRSARVVTENCYGMHKGRWRIWYEKTDVKLVNVEYVTLLCILFHNLCIAMKDPCNPRWCSSVQKLQLDDFMMMITRRAKKNQPISARKLPSGSGSILNDLLLWLTFICKYNFSYHNYMFCYKSIFMKNSKLMSIYHWECYKLKKIYKL